MALVDMFREGHSITKPPVLDNFIFTQWKARMKTFIMAHDMEGWIMICKGLKVPTNEDAWNEKQICLVIFKYFLVWLIHACIYFKLAGVK